MRRAERVLKRVLAEREPDYPVEWELLGPRLFGRLVKGIRDDIGATAVGCHQTRRRVDGVGR